MATRQALAAVETLLLRHSLCSCPPTSPADLEVAGNGCFVGDRRPFSTFREPKLDVPFGFQARAFHAKPAALSFKASPVSQAEFAVDEYPSYDESSKGSGDDEVLEIAKLGISQEIVTALGKKGITTLFPIQVIISLPGKDLFFFFFPF